jgi:hypothetical protein
MATSGSANFSTTRNEIIKAALLNVGGIGRGETPDSDQFTDSAYLLNMIVKTLHADGMPLWAMKQTSFALTATTTYTIGAGATVNTARPLKIVSAFTRVTDDNFDQPVEVITRQEYDNLSNKQSEGVPIKLFYDPRGAANANGVINIWPKPDTTSISDRTLYITYQRPAEDFDASTDEPDFPQEWYMVLVWMLSWALCPSYGIPLEERKVMLMEAEKLHRQALLFDMEEGSMYVEPQLQ